MVKYPLQFEVSAESPAGIDQAWRTGTEHTGRYTEAAIPPEFRGPGGGFSPEDLYAMSLLNCFVATFKVLADHGGVAYQHIDAKGLLTVDRDEAGTPWMKEMQFTVSLVLAAGSDRAQAERLLRKTAQSCLILNSVKTEKTYEFRLSEASAAA